MKKIGVLFFVWVIVITATLNGCKEDCEDCGPTVTSQLIISPEQLSFNDIDTVIVSLSVQPPQKFDWSVSSKPDWIRVEPSSGTINDQILEVKIIPDFLNLEEGLHSGAIEFITNGAGKAQAELQMYAQAHPKIEVTPMQLHFEEETTQKTFKIHNPGTGILQWQLPNNLPWLSFSFYNGYLYNNDSITVTAFVSREGYPVGTQEETIIVMSNAENGNIAMTFTMDVPEFEAIIPSDTAILFNYFIDQVELTLENTGNVASDWNISFPVDYLSVNPVSGNLAVGESVSVFFNVDRSELSSDVYEATATLAFGNNEQKGLMVTVNHYLEEKWLIDGIINDAEYDRVNDVIIAVSESPNEIRRFDPSLQTETSTALNLVPLCVSISPDGNYAAVGHVAKVTLVNLNTMQIENIYNVSADALDIVLAGNGWVYVFPAQNQWEDIRCIELSTGQETLSTGYSIYAGTKAKLHPSGNYIYGANNGLSPSDFEKYNISGGTAAYMYDSPYHGDYSFGGDIWISDDGSRLFARSKNVFTSSENQSNDMIYNGSLSGEGGVQTLDCHTGANRIYTVFTTGSWWEATPGTEVRIYEAEYLGFMGTQEFPGFLVPDGTGGGTFFDSHGYFGFINAGGTKYYALVKAEIGSGMLNNWAIVTLDVE
ncbi:MAG: BACON domain-containing protein [Bacteroidales bacterium]|nr:BACON domain-containing protein [Bacteroidales bacterium]